MTRNLRWNCFDFSKNIIFQTDFFIEISYVELFATTLDDNVSKTRRKEFIDAIAYCLLNNSLYEFAWKWSIDSIVNFFMISFCKINICFMKRNRSFALFQIQFCLSRWQFTLRNVDDTMYFVWLFVSFIECEFFIVFLILNCIAFKQNSIRCFCWDHVLKSKSSWHFFLTKIFCDVFIEIIVRYVLENVSIF